MTLLTKIFWTAVAIIVAGLIALGVSLSFDKKDLTQQVTQLKEQLLKKDAELLACQSATVTEKLQCSFKDSQKEQSDKLLEECYSALAKRIEDESDIDYILSLPNLNDKKEVTDGLKDQNSAAIDFLNRQLLDIH